MRFLRVILPLLMLAACGAPSRELPTQANVDLKKYAGTWYEQARMPNDFQAKCAGDVRADYVLRPGDTLEVTNRCAHRDGTVEVAQGEGRLSPASDPPDPARLEVRFAPAWTSWLPMVWGDYWIIQVLGDYEYSLVGTPDRKFLWVLSRGRTADADTVSRLLGRAMTLGFPVEEIIRQPGSAVGGVTASTDRQ